ncbi:polysaccharide deacetylase family sporulation protein PdaB [Tepidibacillus fermentans]|uniref:Polysaccharide deacetylase family sporulation protein PdaB n=1 Tax=Tepidibacillus fermentans TaxID=1281767 RepID=A0A4R3KEW0_9BACI|nr:polysaccharide deacetylase family sporulation protein PdaB [Tepidibacillus fermentans]TCS81509.1 polysaccharide deacetylase family sporulation protein PdaB [Tepidibacillus fermentans]
MKFIWIFSGKKFKQFMVILTAFFFTIGIVYSERENISVFSNGGTKAIYNVQTEKKQIALTFDISWGEKRPEPILDILEQKGLKGKVTFFLSSPWSEDHPKIVKRIVDSGYEIGSHGHKHVNYSELTDQEIENQILKAELILKELTNQKPTLIRTPNGDFDSRVLKIADRLGYTVIQWDTDSRDWMNPGVDEIINRVLKRAHPGDIVLMHASDSCKQTHEALPIIIDQLKKQGYEFVTVSQLIANAKIETSEIE